jgi:hypothetical protein
MEEREASNTAVLDDKHRFKTPIKGKTGAEIIGYQWVSRVEDGMYGDRRVSDWSAAQTSVPTGRQIVHLFWVRTPDGKETLMGVGATQKALGLNEQRLYSIAKREQENQVYQSKQEKRELDAIEASAVETPNEAARLHRKNTSSAMRSESENEILFLDSVLLSKGGKYLRAGKARQSLLEENGWKVVENDPVKAAVLKSDSLATGIKEAGEELTYNRRNRVVRRAWSDIEGLNPALKAKETTKANFWPKPDYAQMIADGHQPLVAHIVKQVYDSIAAKPVTRTMPTDADFKIYIEAVNRIRDGVMKWINDPAAVRAWAEKNARLAGAMLGAMSGKPTDITSLSQAGVSSLYESVYPGGWRNFQNELHVLGGNKVLKVLQPGYMEIKRASGGQARARRGKYRGIGFFQANRVLRP